MSPWKTLYALTWIIVLEFLVAMMPDAPAWLGWVHVALGLAIVALAFNNHRGVRATSVPGRVKRTARASAQISVMLAILGALLVFDVGAGLTLLFGITVWEVVLLVHVVLAIAILAQAAAVGIAYDMWEEKEFLEWSSPGEVPEHPAERDVATTPLHAAKGPNRPGTL